MVDYLWGAPAEAVFAADPRRQAGRRRATHPLHPRRDGRRRAGGPAGHGPARRSRPGDRERTGGPAPLAESAAAYDRLLQQVGAGEISLDVEAVPLANVEETWQQAGSDRRIVFVP
jgi:hypothetical protein